MKKGKRENGKIVIKYETLASIAYELDIVIFSLFTGEPFK